MLLGWLYTVCLRLVWLLFSDLVTVLLTVCGLCDCLLWFAFGLRLDCFVVLASAVVFAVWMLCCDVLVAWVIGVCGL